MILSRRAPMQALRLPLLFALAVSLSACGSLQTASEKPQMNFAQAREGAAGIDPERKEMAIALAHELRARGHRVWCVPFARNASGIDIRGNAKTWWAQAAGVYDRSHAPRVGAVMAFSATRKMPLGHVAVVSEIVSDREIRIDHANWHRNQISLGMSVIDVSDKNDWSAVRVQSTKTSLGRVYPVAGFIFDADRG